MKINKNIEAYNSMLAFGILLAEDESISYDSFVDITELVKSGKNVNDYKGLGLLFCYKTFDLGANDNKVQFKIEDNVQKGTKEFSTEYVLIADHKNSGKAIIINSKLSYPMKKDAEDAAKLWVPENKRDLHIKMVKIMTNADPVSTSILYKPSPKQSLAVYNFFN